MRFYSVPLLFLGSVDAFAPNGFPSGATTTITRTTPIYSTKPQKENNVVDALESVDATVKGALSGMALAAVLWAAPATMAGNVASTFPDVASSNDVIASSVAMAKEKASGSGTRVNKDPESLLRYGLPINNKEVGRQYVHAHITLHSCNYSVSVRRSIHLPQS